MSDHTDKDNKSAPSKLNLEIVKDCDNFPYVDEEEYTKTTSNLWKFFLPNNNQSHGYVTPFVVDKMPWTTDFHVNPTRKEIHLQPRQSKQQLSYSQYIDELLDLARAQKVFPRLGRKRDETFPILGASCDIHIERSAASLFGVVTRGAHMNIFSRGEFGEFKVWIARRNAQKATYPGMLDNAVAGGVASGETPLECIIHEASEEAAIPEDYLQDNVRAAGCISWFNISDDRAGGEIGLMNPGVVYVYDLQVDREMELVPVDGDIQGFYLMGVQEILKSMASGEFKPSCANVMMDFFIRHGIITAENEDDYLEIVARLHRKLQFPTKLPKLHAGNYAA